MRRAWSLARTVWAIGLGLSAATAAPGPTWETPRLHAELDDHAAWVSLLDRAAARELVPPGVSLPLMEATVAGKRIAADGLSVTGDDVSVRFAGVDTVARLRITVEGDWLRVALAGVTGTRPSRLVLIRLPAAITANLGRRLNAAWDERSAACLLAATPGLDPASAPAPTHATLALVCQDAPGPRLEGAAALLIVCPTPDLDPLLRQASHACGLLTNEDAAGVPAKGTELARGAYWFLGVTERDADRVVDLCERTGFRQVLVASGSWCQSVGHYTFSRNRFADVTALKAFADRLHEHGILVGMHAFASKISKTDAYVTPVPDRRLWVDTKATLAAAVTAEQTEIRCTQPLADWPASPLCRQTSWEGGVEKHREVIVGDEIIQYAAIGPEGRNDTFLGCRRGAWGTRPAPHPAADEARHVGVDGCINGYIIDQETDLLDETTDHLAAIFNECGFDMVYFDGGEDVPKTRFNHYVTRFQDMAMRKFHRRPILHMGTILTHGLWHSFGRSATVDTYLNTLNGEVLSGKPVGQWITVRQHIDRSVAYLLSVRQDRLPGELGWFGIWPRGEHTDGLQLDEVEYLMCRSLAYDAPISLETSFPQMEAHPLTPGILPIIKAYDELRLARTVPPEVRRQFEEKGADFALVRENGQPAFHRVAPLPTPLPAAWSGARCLLGPRPGGALAVVWPIRTEGELVLPAAARLTAVRDLAGAPLESRTDEAGRRHVPLALRRTTLEFDGATEDEARQWLLAAEFARRPVARLWVRAADATSTAGDMRLGSACEVRDEGALSGDVLVCTGAPAPNPPRPWYAEYTVALPRAGDWTVWARVRYPQGADESFGLVPAGADPTLQGSQVLGNCGVHGNRWHWTGRGDGTASQPPGHPLTLRLPAGPFTFRIYAREGPGAAAANPRLDCLCFTDDPDAVPDDRLATEALAPTARP